MRDIAARAGMLAGSMYYHFPSKNDLIAAVYEAGVAESATRWTGRAGSRRAGHGRELEAACAAHLERAAGRSGARRRSDDRRLEPAR